jgi:hypothetical protein
MIYLLVPQPPRGRGCAIDRGLLAAAGLLRGSWGQEQPLEKGQGEVDGDGEHCDEQRPSEHLREVAEDEPVEQVAAQAAQVDVGHH